MERFQYLRKVINSLLEESPLTSNDVILDVRHLMEVGEEELAFDTMCSWIYEDSLSISTEYYERLVAFAAELGSLESVEKLDELIEDS